MLLKNVYGDFSRESEKFNNVKANTNAKSDGEKKVQKKQVSVSSATRKYTTPDVNKVDNKIASPKPQAIIVKDDSTKIMDQQRIHHVTDTNPVSSDTNLDTTKWQLVTNSMKKNAVTTNRL